MSSGLIFRMHGAWISSQVFSREIAADSII